MRYRKLGSTGLTVSEIGLGAEWLERHTEEECRAVIDRCAENGINIFDCWMSEPNVRTNIGKAISGSRDRWIIQGHIGSTWNGQYVRTRDLEKVKPAFEDLLKRFDTDYIDLGMINYVDADDDYDNLTGGPFLEYVRKLKADGVIRHVGMSTHNPRIALRAVKDGIVETLMFSINPAFDLRPATDNLDSMFEDEYDSSLHSIDPERSELYRTCERMGIGITVMKSFEGGRLLDAATSPFGIAMTPIQCIHYALDKPAVASVMAGFNTPEEVDEACRYETASDEEKDYATVLAKAPKNAMTGQCTYCGHCKPCPVDIDIAMVNKLYDLAVMQDEVPESVRNHYEVLEHKASECLGCGGCETRCPFNVKVTERMKKAAELFES
ncbi:MAG: aldo/keto reductase [Oscillospiraceae bacterium]|jgi:predicted aldo/keto reductase-like oxidoreductase